MLYSKTLGCMLGGLIGDAIGTPTEGMDYQDIAAKYGWVGDFDCDGTDDTVMKVLLSDALIRTDGYATLDDWAAVWLDNWQDIFSSKMAKFFISVLHTAQKLRRHATPRMAALGNMPSSSSAMCISPVGIVNACNPAMAALQTYNLASLIHVQDVGFCQDGAVAMATAVAEAFRRRERAERARGSTAYILPSSGAEMLEAIDAAEPRPRDRRLPPLPRGRLRAGGHHVLSDHLRLARDRADHAGAVLLADGDVEKCVTYGANFGRDADTIASMAGPSRARCAASRACRPESVARRRRSRGATRRLAGPRRPGARREQRGARPRPSARFPDRLARCASDRRRCGSRRSAILSSMAAASPDPDRVQVGLPLAALCGDSRCARCCCALFDVLGVDFAVLRSPAHRRSHELGLRRRPHRGRALVPLRPGPSPCWPAALRLP